MRLKLAEQEDLAKDHRIREKIKARKAEVDQRLKELGAEVIETAQPTEYAFRYRLRYRRRHAQARRPRSSRSRAPRCSPSAARSS